MLSIRYQVRRLLRQPLITGSVLVGIVVAIAVGVAAPLATDALVELGLRATLNALPRATQNIQLTRVGQAFNAAFARRVQQQLGDLLVDDYTVSYSPILPGERV